MKYNRTSYVMGALIAVLTASIMNIEKTESMITKEEQLEKYKQAQKNNPNVNKDNKPVARTKKSLMTISENCGFLEDQKISIDEKIKLLKDFIEKSYQSIGLNRIIENNENAKLYQEELFKYYLQEKEKAQKIIFELEQQYPYTYVLFPLLVCENKKLIFPDQGEDVCQIEVTQMIFKELKNTELIKMTGSVKDEQGTLYNLYPFNFPFKDFKIGSNGLSVGVPFDSNQMQQFLQNKVNALQNEEKTRMTLSLALSDFQSRMTQNNPVLYFMKSIQQMCLKTFQANNIEENWDYMLRGIQYSIQNMIYKILNLYYGLSSFNGPNMTFNLGILEKQYKSIYNQTETQYLISLISCQKGSLTELKLIYGALSGTVLIQPTKKRILNDVENDIENDM